MLDRGNKKWSSIMPTELLEGLNHIIEEEKNIEKPILSEDQQEEIQRMIFEAIEYHQEIDITYYKSKRLHHIRGKITNINNLQMHINTGEDIKCIATKDIIKVNIV